MPHDILFLRCTNNMDKDSDKTKKPQVATALLRALIFMQINDECVSEGIKANKTKMNLKLNYPSQMVVAQSSNNCCLNVHSYHECESSDAMPVC